MRLLLQPRDGHLPRRAGLPGLAVHRHLRAFHRNAGSLHREGGTRQVPLQLHRNRPVARRQVHAARCVLVPRLRHRVAMRLLLQPLKTHITLRIGKNLFPSHLDGRLWNLRPIRVHGNGRNGRFDDGKLRPPAISIPLKRSFFAITHVEPGRTSYVGKRTILYPAIFIKFQEHLAQPHAPSKRPYPKHRYAMRDEDLGQLLAHPECVIPNLLYSLRQSECF